MSSDQTSRIEAFLRSLPKSRSKDTSPIEQGTDPIEEFLWSLLLWDAPRTKALRAYERINHHVVDFNELRISLPDEIQDVLGARYPRVEERSFLIQKSLNAIFQTQNAVTLESVTKIAKRDAKKFLDNLESTPPFVAARVMLLALGGHAVPLDDRMHERLLNEGVLDEGTDVRKASSLFERVVKAGDGPSVHAAMLKWIEKKSTRTNTRKKTSRKVPPRSRSTRK